ncbi:calmodulin [Acrasis kona]|uniref:Calmodulin n=1 Tax=Acrasis kona TaxID=1008807 RepID=A0AAW2ZKX8_9EUKA
MWQHNVYLILKELLSSYDFLVNSNVPPNKCTMSKQSEYKETFALFEKDNGSISGIDLVTALRSLGHNLSDEDLTKELSTCDPEMLRLMDVEYVEFLKIVNRKAKDDERTEESIKEAFSVFDTSASGFVKKEEFKRVLTTLGDKLSDDIVDILIEEAGVDELGNVQLSQLVKLMLTN